MAKSKTLTNKPKATTAKKAPKTAKKTAAHGARAITAAEAASSPAVGPLPPVRVRMYRQGLGDCFLITFNPGGGAAERHMLIDCGTLGGTTNGVGLQKVADHVAETIGTGRLHVVVATHEHWDHVAGFAGPMRQFKGKVDDVWLAWTENPQDKDAQALAKGKRDLAAALAGVAAAAPASAAAADIWGMFGFLGADAPSATGAAADLGEKLNDAMAFVRTGLGGRVTYHEPGDLIEVPGLPGFRIYVLGPPRDKEALQNLGEHGSSELYGIAAGLGMGTPSDGGAAGPLAPADQAELDLQFPFDPRFRGCGEAARRQRYPAYDDPDQRWRQVEDDWLGLASDLALQLDNLTNNSSLALAIERVADGKVLLFPADAQLGNWLSWHAPTLTWTVPDRSGGKRQVTAADLLSRTVFYKVGHHCSHNATAREKGLELMVRESELTAFIPVDRAVALNRHPKDSWQMPARPLYRRLLERCQGRVVRADTGWAAEVPAGTTTGVELAFAGLATAAEWNGWRASQQQATHVSDKDNRFVEYTLR